MTIQTAEKAPDLSPETLARVGRYMGIEHIGLGEDCVWIHYDLTSRANCLYLRHFATDVLEKMGSEGRDPRVFVYKDMRSGLNGTCIFVDDRDMDQRYLAPTWPEAVLQAAAALQGLRECNATPSDVE